MTSPENPWTELLADLPGALRDFVCLCLFAGAVIAFAFIASVRLTEPPEPARATLITQRGF